MRGPPLSFWSTAHRHIELRGREIPADVVLTESCLHVGRTRYVFGLIEVLRRHMEIGLEFDNPRRLPYSVISGGGIGVAVLCCALFESSNTQNLGAHCWTAPQWSAMARLVPVGQTLPLTSCTGGSHSILDKCMLV